MKKKVFTAALLLLMTILFAGCGILGNSADITAMQEQLRQMQAQLNEAQKQGFKPDDAAAAPAQTPQSVDAPSMPAEDVPKLYAYNCTVNGESMLNIEQAGEYTAIATLEYYQEVYCWMINGRMVTDEFNIDVLGNERPYTEAVLFFECEEADTTVTAVLRDKRTVYTVNAHMQFLNEKGKPVGQKYTEFIFGEDYEHPVSGEIYPGGWISVHVEADVPRGYEVDFWIINGIPYYYDRHVAGFTVYSLDETTVYEAVLKPKDVKSTPRPTATAAPHVWQAPEVSSKPEPVVYYSVSCRNCTFSGGGYSGAEGGSVPAGTVITVTSNFSHDSIVWEGDYVDGEWDQGAGIHTHAKVKSFTYTVNKDCSFICREMVN